MNAAEYRFSWQGDTIRVVVAGDVLALPDERWSMAGFGRSITTEWLAYEAKLPGPKPRRAALAACLVRALEAHHRGGVADGDGDAHPRGPSVPCAQCSGSGFTPKVAS